MQVCSIISTVNGETTMVIECASQLLKHYWKEHIAVRFLITSGHGNEHGIASTIFDSLSQPLLQSDGQTQYFKQVVNSSVSVLLVYLNNIYFLYQIKSSTCANIPMFTREKSTHEPRPSPNTAHAFYYWKRRGLVQGQSSIDIIILPTDWDWTLHHMSAQQQYIIACALCVVLDSWPSKYN